MKSLTKLIDNWSVLVADLQEIALSTEAQFKLAVREQAERLEGRMTSRNFILLAMFYKDVLQELVYFCKDLQNSPGVIFDKFEHLTRISLVLEDLKEKDGKSLGNFKKQVSCWENSDWVKGCTETQIINSEHVKWRGFMLSPRDVADGIPVLNDVRNSTLDRIQEELSEYFPAMDELRSFGVLDPSNFPSGTNLLAMYGIGRPAHMMSAI